MEESKDELMTKSNGISDDKIVKFAVFMEVTYYINDIETPLTKNTNVFENHGLKDYYITTPYRHISATDDQKIAYTIEYAGVIHRKISEMSYMQKANFIAKVCEDGDVYELVKNDATSEFFDHLITTIGYNPPHISENLHEIDVGIVSVFVTLNEYHAIP